LATEAHLNYANERSRHVQENLEPSSSRTFGKCHFVQNCEQKCLFQFLRVGMTKSNAAAHMMLSLLIDKGSINYNILFIKNNERNVCEVPERDFVSIFYFVHDLVSNLSHHFSCGCVRVKCFLRFIFFVEAIIRSKGFVSNLSSFLEASVGQHTSWSVFLNSIFLLKKA